MRRSCSCTSGSSLNDSSTHACSTQKGCLLCTRCYERPHDRIMSISTVENEWSTLALVFFSFCSMLANRDALTRDL
ncbi:hypothetical protein HBI56_033030 [Parastagonospora nodorum]|uniref:Uncharacterized protein n=1 Tax=Phaeosphaeria nodorum (strain SN15 / ATCC MYA-4574 / FGSC 10173) TaxID=321614 RepID=A0A7U2EYL6_PHANO|nr:hypothetical protein HBH56_020820 [Parastagonospora nodorum]QRC95454.1 hypothetical protein JI435_407380 [Parastagonospora nodorum SN15]KAH3937445.1 hypothetical protein HBH54_013680 [Parastagonospora nodorum]KAH3944112.1 hypothetical protein HBH53_163080 [Parastagonospora nodorum]KAH3967552.1 hypothetical protein HBH51_137410 [Parastagonospora nodorum]